MFFPPNSAGTRNSVARNSCTGLECTFCQTQWPAGPSSKKQWPAAAAAAFPATTAEAATNPAKAALLAADSFEDSTVTHDGARTTSWQYRLCPCLA